MSTVQRDHPTAGSAPGPQQYGIHRGSRRSDPLLRCLGRLATLPALLFGLAAVTVLAMGPLRHVDVALQRSWLRQLAPGWQPFFQDQLDRIASQSVDAPLLVYVAVVLASRRRSWRPLAVAAAVEVGFFGLVGLLKVVLARPAPVLGDPAFFHGGLGDHGWDGISFPSGHTAEAVLVYGGVVYLLTAYSHVSRRTIRVLVAGVVLVALNAAFVSFVLGWHWMSDLVGGWLAGAVVLRLVVVADRWRSPA